MNNIKINNNIYLKIKLFCLLAIMVVFANKVDASTDSLKQIWMNVAQPDTIRFNAINAYYEKKLYAQPDSVILLTAYHIELALQKHSEKQRAIALNKKGIAYNLKGDYDKALVEMNQALDIFSSLKDSINIANTYNHLAITHTHLTKYQQALNYYTKCLILTKAKKLEDLKAKVLLNIGLIYYKISSYDLALTYFNISLNICEKLELETLKGLIWTNTGYANFKKKKYHQAIEDSQKALKIFQPLNLQYYIADNHSLNARIYQELNQVDSAMFYLEKALEFHQAIGSNVLVLQDQIILANIFFPTDVNKATQIGEEVLKTGDYIDHSMKMELYNLLYRCYHKKKNYPSSLSMLENYNRYADSLLIEQDKVAVTKKAIQSEYESKILNTQLKNKQSQTQLKLSQLKKTYALLFCGAVIILFLIFYYRAKRIILSKEKEGLVNKVAHLKELENTRHQLIQSEKMASLGQLTAGVAHEINNPVNFISSGVIGLKKTLEVYIERPKSEASEELVEDMNDMISAIEEGAKRTKNIVKSLRLFSREDTEDYIEADIIIGLESTFRLLSNKLKQGISLEKDFEKKAMPVFCFPGQLNQVFMNVLLNAIQAVEGTGIIKVEVKEQAENMVITISDNGYGIPDDKKQKIFEPFYTTKDVQEGTGLGLSITFGIIKKHKGSIEVKDNEPRGTTVIIKLPKKKDNLIR